MKSKPILQQLSVDQLVRGKYQPRRHFDSTQLQELADSIKTTDGLLQPIVARPTTDGKFEIIAGERRWRAAQLAGLTEVSCLVSHYTNEQALQASIIENINRAWIFSSGYPLMTTDAREGRAKKRCEWLLNELKTIPILAKTFSICDEIQIQTNFSKESYQSAVKKVKNFILEGDIFEANISQRFMLQLSKKVEAFNLFRRLYEMNPAPFSAYLFFGDTVLVSASPERFLKLTGDQIETRPIKGTRRRGKSQEEDLQIANELIASEKDQAENVMIVDLLRNDLSRVCEDHSVKVPKLCGLESYTTVHHLVSVVTGKLQAQYNAVDLLKAAFPGGSITGAPKIRAMEIIAEIEPTKRGPYCGSIGYIGFNGDMDTSIIIRTYAIKNNVVTFQAGGAIVVDSDPLLEYEETLTKVKALRSALIE